jgi:hypothetical protein
MCPARCDMMASTIETGGAFRRLLHMLVSMGYLARCSVKCECSRYIVISKDIRLI